MIPHRERLLHPAADSIAPDLRHAALAESVLTYNQSTHQPAHRIYDLCGEDFSAALATHARFSFPPLSHSPTNSPFMSDRRAALRTTSAWHTIRQRLIPRPDVQPCWCGTFPTCLRRAGGGQNSKEGGTRRGYTIKRCSSAYRVRSAVELRWSFSIMRAR